MSILELRDVTAAYGPFRALFGVSFEIGSGEAVSLLGTNGAGKTTVARVASGLIPPSTGSVFVNGQDFSAARTYEFARAGISHAPEGRSVFATLTVEENLALSFRRSKGRRGVRPAINKAYEMFPRLGGRSHQLAGTLSGGEQRMLSLSRVLVESPKLLIADELSLGLAPIIVDSAYKILETIKQAGTALLIVEQQVHHALAVSDRAMFLDRGLVTWSGPAAQATDIADQLFEGSIGTDPPPGDSVPGRQPGTDHSGLG